MLWRDGGETLKSHFGRRSGLVYIWVREKRSYAVDETELSVSTLYYQCTNTQATSSSPKMEQILPHQSSFCSSIASLPQKTHNGQLRIPVQWK